MVGVAAMRKHRASGIVARDFPGSIFNRATISLRWLAPSPVEGLNVDTQSLGPCWSITGGVYLSLGINCLPTEAGQTLIRETCSLYYPICRAANALGCLGRSTQLMFDRLPNAWYSHRGTKNPAQCAVR